MRTGGLWLLAMFLAGCTNGVRLIEVGEGECSITCLNADTHLRGDVNLRGQVYVRRQVCTAQDFERAPRCNPNGD